MAKTQEYQIVLRDIDGCESHRTDRIGLKAAKDTARDIASNRWVRSAYEMPDYTHEDIQSSHVEVIDEAGDVVWDTSVESGVAK